MANTAGGILIATESGSGVLDDGTAFDFHKGITRVREGHPAIEKWPQFFKPLDVQHELEEMTAEPGRKRGER